VRVDGIRILYGTIQTNARGVEVCDHTISNKPTTIYDYCSDFYVLFNAFMTVLPPSCWLVDGEGFCWHETSAKMLESTYQQESHFYCSDDNAFLSTFSPLIVDDWNDIYALTQSEYTKLMQQQSSAMDFDAANLLPRSHFSFHNIDAAFWFFRSQNPMLLKALEQHFSQSQFEFEIKFNRTSIDL